MAAATTTVLDPALAPGGAIPPAPPAIDEGPPRPPRVLNPPPPVSNARLAMMAFIVFESMLFAGLLGGYVVLRWGSAVWPPAGQPYLPLAVTWVNTAILLGSCFPLARSARALRRAEERPAGGRIPGAPRAADPAPASSPASVRGLSLAAAMGALFLAVQGFEWVRLLAHGMTVAHGTYGAIFVMLIGAHGLHVLAAVVWLGTVAILAATGRIAPGRSAALDVVAMYWYFVCAVWIALFALVYLA